MVALRAEFSLLERNIVPIHRCLFSSRESISLLQLSMFTKWPSTFPKETKWFQVPTTDLAWPGCSRLSNAHCKDTHVLIPGTCECELVPRRHFVWVCAQSDSYEEFFLKTILLLTVLWFQSRLSLRIQRTSSRISRNAPQNSFPINEHLKTFTLSPKTHSNVPE